MQKGGIVTDYGFIKTVDKPFEDVLGIVKNELKKEGFGILSTIDVREKFKEKLGIDFTGYTIFGACHPPSAYEAIKNEENIGLMLPCNVVVYERKDKVAVGVIKPTVAMQMIENDGLAEIAQKIEQKLKRVFDAV
jgi:uncharacterized protein (DUF302 family)